MADKLEAVVWAAIAIQTIVLIIFNYYICKFFEKFKTVNALSKLCFFFIELTLISKIILRGYAVIDFNINYKN